MVLIAAWASGGEHFWDFPGKIRVLRGYYCLKFEAWVS